MIQSSFMYPDSSSRTVSIFGLWLLLGEVRFCQQIQQNDVKLRHLCQSNYAQMLEMISTLFYVSGLECIDKGLRGLPWSQEEKRAWFEWIKPLHEIMKPRLPQLGYACNHSYCCGLYLIISSYLSTQPLNFFHFEQC